MRLLTSSSFASVMSAGLRPSPTPTRISFSMVSSVCAVSKPVRVILGTMTFGEQVRR